MDETLFSKWYWYASIVCWPIGAIVSTIITIVHTRNMVLDFCQKERTSLSQRNKIPAITWNYKLTAIFVLLSVLSYTLLMVVSAFTAFEFINHCHFFAVLDSWLYQFAKMFMYLTFIIRLYSVYNESAYAYNQKMLLTFSIFIVIISFTINILLTLTLKTTKKPSGMCVVSCKLYILGMIFVYDLTLSIGTAIAFIKPIKRLRKLSFDLHSSPETQSGSIRLLNVANKYAILSFMASSTTLIFMIFAGIGVVFVAPFEFLTNIICMLLMLPYYKDSKYYNKICCLCIKCVENCCMDKGISSNGMELVSTNPAPQSTEF